MSSSDSSSSSSSDNDQSSLPVLTPLGPIALHLKPDEPLEFITETGIVFTQAVLGRGDETSHGDRALVAIQSAYPSFDENTRELIWQPFEAYMASLREGKKEMVTLACTVAPYVPVRLTVIGKHSVSLFGHSDEMDDSDSEVYDSDPEITSPSSSESESSSDSSEDTSSDINAITQEEYEAALMSSSSDESVDSPWSDPSSSSEDASTHKKQRIEEISSSSSSEETDVLRAEDVKSGKGKKIQDGSLVTISYVGRIHDQHGEIFDRNSSFKFRIGAGEVIIGMEEGLREMKVGGKRRLWIPSVLAYGSKGAADAVPPFSDLYFEIQLKKVV